MSVSWVAHRKRHLARIGMSMAEVAEILAAERRVRQAMAQVSGSSAGTVALLCIPPSEPDGTPMFVLADPVFDEDELIDVPGLLVPVEMRL